jgi:hypothetical protein
MLSALIGDIYDAALDSNIWMRVLERCCSVIGGASAVLYWHDVASKNSAAVHLFNDDPHWTKLYFDKYLPMNPVFPAASFVDAGRVYTPTDLIPEAELHETRFHKEWVQPQGIVDVVCVNLEKSATSSSVLNIRRDATHGMVDDDARRRMALLIPHFQRGLDRAIVRPEQDEAGGADRSARSCRRRGVFVGTEWPDRLRQSARARNA